MPGKLSPTELLWQMYCEGAFPMADDHGSINFYKVLRRAVFPNCEMYVSSSLAKRMRRDDYRVTFDTAFAHVMRACIRSEGNWLTEELISWYTQAHREGWAHSCEVWIDQEIVGGVYGVAVGASFSAESMFHVRSDMSKIALYSLMKKCRELGFVQFDAQIINNHTRSLGCIEVSMAEFEHTLARAIQKEIRWA